MIGGIYLLKDIYTYHELEKEYDRLNEFINSRPKFYEYKNKSGFQIEKEQPITLFNVGVLINHLKNTLDIQNDKTKLDLDKELKPFDTYLNAEVDYFEGLKNVKFPFGLRNFVEVEVPRSQGEKMVITSYYTFVLRAIKHTSEKSKINIICLNY